MTDALSGKRIVVTRSPGQAEVMCRQLEALGAVAIPFPAIQLIPLSAPELDEALAGLASYDWLVFTSGNAVRFFWDRLLAANPVLARHLPVRIAAIGSATNRLLAEKGVKVDSTPDEFTGQQLALGLGNVTGQQILLPRARIGRPEIVSLLREQGAIVTDIALYDTITAEPDRAALAELEKGVDVVTFTSPSSVRNFLKIVGQVGEYSHSVIACIGPSTAAEAVAAGLTVAVMPENYTIDSLISAVADYFAKEHVNA